MQVAQFGTSFQRGQHAACIVGVAEHRLAGDFDSRRERSRHISPGDSAVAEGFHHLRLDMLRDQFARAADGDDAAVVEVYGFGEGSAEAWAESARALAPRVEVTGETAFCYTDDARRVLASLEGRAELRYLHRAANLEDVFLKLTGRELRD